MRNTLLTILALFAFSIQALEPHFMDQPAISPDGESICFRYLSDLWSVPFKGGDAQRLTQGEAVDWSPVYSPDGSSIAFVSNREGWSGIYLIPAQGGTATQISHTNYRLNDWFPDGKSLLVSYYTTGKGHGYYRLYLDGEVQELTFINSTNGVLDASGTKIIYSRRGYITRERYTGSHNGELWVYDIAHNSFARLTNTPFSEYYPVFSHISPEVVYFSASDGEVAQLYRASLQDAESRTPLTDFSQWSVRQISIARTSDRMVFTKFDELWRYDPSREKTEKIQIRINEDLQRNVIHWSSVKNSFDKYAVSADGKLIAFSYKFDLFAMPEEGGDVKQLTFDHTGINDVEILSDNKTILFTKMTNGAPHLFTLDITNPEKLHAVSWSKDKHIESITVDRGHVFINYALFNRKHYLAITDEKLKSFSLLFDDLFISDRPALSPDERYLLCTDVRQGVWSSGLHIYDLEQKEDHQVFLYHGSISNTFWGKDNRSIFFSREGNIFRMDLLKRDDFYTEEDHWKDILHPKEKKDDDKEDKKSDDTDDSKDEEETPAVEIDFQDIDLRVSTVVSKLGHNIVVYVEDDSTFYYRNYFDKKCALWKSDYENKSDKKIASLSEDHDDLRYNKKNKSFYYLDASRLKKLNPNSKKTETVKNSFKYRYDSFQLNEEVFVQAWDAFWNGFYDPQMHGVDWKKSLKIYRPYLKYALTPDIMGKIFREMMGEVNASHTGFYPREEEEYPSYPVAQIGASFSLKDRPKRGLILNKVYRKSQLYDPFDVRAGDILLEVDGVKITDKTEITPLFANKVGEKIHLKIAQGKETIDAAIKGLSWWSNYSLFYDNWVEERRARVEAAAPNLGYAHIRSMNWSSYNKFMQDLFARNADKDGLIIDVRNNGGGYIHDWLVEALTKKQYAISSSRNFDASKVKSPGEICDKPLVLLINEDSFSDAEIFPNLFRYFKLGTIIGMPTSGSVIGTGHETFMDGSSMRMPMNGWYLLDGTNMEGHGVQPDIYVEPTPQQIIDDDDVQLQRAILELKKKI